MHRLKITRIISLRAAAYLALIALCMAANPAHAASLKYSKACVEFQNRWHMAQGPESPSSTTCFNGHVATGAGDASAPHDGSYTLVRSQFGLPFYGGVSLRPVDSDADGIPNSTEGESDPDGDSLGNWQDPDSDDDGVPDQTEAGPNPFTPLDSDGDGAPDYIDLDSDDDTLPDTSEGLGDPDLDDLPNYLDLDSDEDGWPDEDEAAAGSDPYNSDSVPLPLRSGLLGMAFLMAGIIRTVWWRKPHIR